jgi:DNA (cytosine-5)-methyltransferase 1
MPATDLCHPEDLRPLSIQEYKRIQEFPDTWEICGGLIDKYKQIGNAVPVSMGHAVGKLITNALNGIMDHPPQHFKFSRYRNTCHSEWRYEYLMQQTKVKTELLAVS